MRDEKMMASGYFADRINIEIKNSSRISKRGDSKSSSRQNSTHRIKLKMKSDHKSQETDKENNKSIVLKFDRLQHKNNENKPEIRRRKIKGSMHWEEKHANNAL